MKEIMKAEKIRNIYYNSYFIIINSIKLHNTELWDDLNEPLKKSAESLEILSNLKDNDKLDSDELLFDSILIYSITNYYSRAYVLTKNNPNLNLPKYKEVIFQFMNRDLKNLRNNLREYNLEKIEAVLKKYNFDLTVRAEQLSIEIFVEIANNL